MRSVSDACPPIPARRDGRRGRLAAPEVRRALAVGLVVLGVGACAGCTNQMAAVFAKLLTPFVPEEKVRAEFRLSGKSVLVLVDTSDPALRSRFPRLEAALAEEVGRILAEEEAAGPIVPARSVEAARLTENEFDHWSVVQVGEYFNVDLVLHLQLFEFRLKDDPASTVMHGSCETALRVVSTESGEQVWPVLRSARLVTAETLPTLEPETRAENERVLIEGLADKVARHFYTYKKRDLPLRPKVR